MDILTAKSLSERLKISMDHVVREEYEIVLLKDIYESGFGKHLVFKGGTALRLAYGSPRFSEDLDFILMEDFDRAKFTDFLKNTGKRYPAVSSIETVDKFYTVFALVKIKETYMERAFCLKIEISKREKKLLRGKNYSEKIIKSETTPLTILARVASLEMILHEKEDALKNRKAARDVFDYWYINQLMRKEIKADFSNYDRVEAKSELHRLLPRNYWRLVDTWLG